MRVTIQHAHEGGVAQANLPDNQDPRLVGVSLDGSMAIVTNREHQSITFVSVEWGYWIQSMWAAPLKA